MKKNRTLNLRLFALTGILGLLSFISNAQTVLINPTAEGGFELGPTFADNGWTSVNTAVTNGSQWYLGSTTLTNGSYTFAPTGVNAAYASSDLGLTWAYQTSGASSASHFYRDVTFPAGETAMNLSFRFNANGESTYDDIHVYLCPTTLTPAVNQPTGTSTTPTWTGTGTPIYMGRYNLLSAGSGSLVNLPLSPVIVGNCSAPATWRLVFTWKNDGSGGTNPPAAIDDISLISAPSTITLAGGNFTIDNTLPTGGSNFQSFTEAIVALNSASACGPFLSPVVFDVTAGQTFNELPPVITATGTALNTITFQKLGAGANPVITPTGTSGNADAGITISGGDYFIFDGIDINSSANTSVEYGYLLRNISATNGAQFNTISNFSVTLNRGNITTSTSSGVMVTASTTGGGVAPTAATGANSENKFYNFTVTNAINGVYLNGNTTYRDLNIFVGSTTCGTRNTITNVGPTVSTFTSARGIYATGQEGLKIYNNDISNVAGNQSATYGIQNTSLYGNNELYGNQVSNVSVFGSATTTSIAYGFNIALATTGTHTAKIYNNAISNVYTSFTGTATTTRRAIGLYVASGSATGVYEVDNNSVSIGAGLSPTYSNSVFEIGGSTASYIVRGNIFANYTGAQTTARHSVWATTAAATIGAGSSANYNDLYIQNDLGVSGFTAITNTTTRTSIADFAAAITTPVGIEANSITANPLFIDNNSNLHAQAIETNAVVGFTTQAWVTADIDCQDRSTLTPNDLGADAYDIVYCAGTPDPSTTVASVGTSCPSIPFNLSLGTVYSGVGFTYQWQSSADGVTYSNIASATNSTLTTSLTASTYYQCIITCSVSGLTATSSATQVTLNSFLNCYCTSSATNTADDDIGQVAIGSLVNPAVAPTPLTSNPTSTNLYTNYSALPASDFGLGTTNTISVTQINQTANYYQCDLGIYIDFNQDGDFADAGETVYTGVGPASAPATGPHFTGSFVVPATATLGNTKMRVVLNETGTTTACGTYTYGETEDYTINITCPTLTAPTGTGSSVCAGNTATLNATTSLGTISWYDAPVGGTNVGSGNSFTSPVLATTTSYYAQADFTGCPSGPRTEVIATVDPVNAVLTAIDVTCNGGSNGSFSLGTVTCGVLPFTYSVDGGAFGSIPTNLVAGTYSIVIKDNANFLSAPQSITISQPTVTIGNPVVGPNGSLCVGDLSEVVTATSSLSSTTTVSFNLGSGVAVAGSATVNSNVLTTLPAGAIVTSTNLVFSNVTTTGGEWPSDMNVSLTGASTLSSISMAPINTSVTNAGPYTRPASNLNNAGGLVNFTLVNTYSGTATIGSIDLVVTYQNPATVNWYDAATVGTLIGTGNSFETVGTTVLPNSTTPGVYNFYAEGSNGTCVSPSRTLVTVTVNALPTVDAGIAQAVCAGTSVTLNGSGATSYSWDNSVTNGTAFTPTSTLTYVVNGTDANGCINTDNTTVTVNALPLINAGSDVVVCFGQSVTLSGTSAETITWNNGISNGVSFVPSTTTTYTATVTDINTCTNSDQVTVTVNSLPAVNAGSDVTICAGESVTLNGTGATSYTWDNGVSNGISFIPVSNSTYTVTGTDGNGCTNTDNLVLTVNTLPTVDAGNDTTVCAGSTVNLVGSGASTYTWDNGISNAVDFTANSTTNYTVTGTDGNGCTNTDMVTVNVNALPMVNAGSDIAVCQNGQAILAGTGAVTYTWNNGITNNVSFVVLANNTYTVTGTDSNGCVNTDDVNVTVNALPVVDAGSNISQCGNQNVTLNASGAVVYSWNNGVTDGVAFDSPFGTTAYIVTGVDALGCSNTDIVLVTINSIPVATITQVDALTLTATPSNESYQWIDCGTNLPILGETSSLFTASENGSYSVIVTSSEGCSDTSSCSIIDGVGLTTLGNDKGISLAPNPTNGDVYVNFNSLENVAITIYDAQGKLVKTINNVSNGMNLELNSVEPGVYMVHINSNGTNFIERVVKN